MVDYGLNVFDLGLTAVDAVILVETFVFAGGQGCNDVVFVRRNIGFGIFIVVAADFADVFCVALFCAGGRNYLIFIVVFALAGFHLVSIAADAAFVTFYSVLDAIARFFVSDYIIMHVFVGENGITTHDERRSVTVPFGGDDVYAQSLIGSRTDDEREFCKRSVRAAFKRFAGKYVSASVGDHNNRGRLSRTEIKRYFYFLVFFNVYVYMNTVFSCGQSAYSVSADGNFFIVFKAGADDVAA